MAITDPRDISGLLAWYSPEYEAANYSDGNQLTTVTDLSGNANHATAFTVDTAKPLYKATGGPSGGAQRFRFEAGGYIKLPSGIMGSSAAGEIMCMVKGDYLTSSSQGWWHFGSDSTVSNHYPYSSSLYDDWGRAARIGPNSMVVNPNTWHRVTVWSAFNDWSFQQDSNVVHSTSANTVGWKTVPTIGNSGVTPSNTSTDTFEGDYGTIVLYNRKLTTGERSDLITWMAAHPSGGTPAAAIPEVTGDLTGTGTTTATVDTVIAVVTGALTGTGTMSATVDNAVLTGPTPADDAVSLAVRVGNRHITREVAGLQFRKEAIGGLKSIGLRLSRPLDRFDRDIQPLSSVYVYNGRTAETVAEGRVTDLGRSASASDGQQFDVVAFGPAQQAADRTFPYILIDQSLENWRRSEYSTKNATTQTDERGIDTPVLQVEAPEPKTITTSWMGDWVYRAVRRAGMKLARVSCDWDAGVTDADYLLAAYTRTGSGASPGNIDSDTANTAGGSLAGSVGGSNFTDGHDVVSLRALRNSSGTTGAEAQWFQFYNVIVRAMCKNADGTDITSGYTLDYVSAYRVVNDLLGRVLDQFDGANATVSSAGTYQIDQFAYPDGVTAEQVLNDLMALEPAFRWTTGPNLTGSGYSFSWEPWTTSVRYEVTLDDGGDFPASTQELFNEVTVRYRSRNGLTHTVTRTLACATLDDAGITRSTIIDAADEIGSANGAIRLGDNFLADHNVPKNAGSLNISRPIRDLAAGRMVDPFEIEPGELIRVRGIESYPDALNASSNDGLTVFRIWAMTYASDNNTATLELDTDARTTSNALRKLAKRRPRKR